MIFEKRHIGPNEAETESMLACLGVSSLDELVDRALPDSIRIPEKISERLNEKKALSEFQATRLLRKIASRNQVCRSFIGMGYYDCVVPPAIQRNIFENPGWYTQYTPYQAEISQGRLEALLNYQTMVSDLTALPVANASLLDEATAAAEAMNLCRSRAKVGASIFFVSNACHPQTIGVVTTRASFLGVEVVVGDHRSFVMSDQVFGALVQYPATDGIVHDYSGFIEKAHAVGALVAVATDLLALTMLKAPGEFGADIALGNSQRFGVPMGYGGPHAAFFAVKDDLKRIMPGRLIGVSKDSAGKPAMRLALQTREQHIRREKATSNICTAQVLLAVMASMYAVYHGPKGLRAIAQRVHGLARRFAETIKAGGKSIAEGAFFDTVRVSMSVDEAATILARAKKKKINLVFRDNSYIPVAFDEAKGEEDLAEILEVFGVGSQDVGSGESEVLEAFIRREPGYLSDEVFNRYHSETEFLRYVKRLEARDLSLCMSMIPLGSCTMKLNAASEMYPISWEEFNSIHPFAPSEQAKGYRELFNGLERWLKDVTGFSAVSFQPNSGAAGEYAGLVTVRSYQKENGQGHRDICLIPHSAHGTNPASAAMAGLEVVEIACDQKGNIDLKDLEEKLLQYSDRVAVLMVTYPSTHGVFEASIKKICAMLHKAGAQVYMDGANLNALVGLVRPVDIGADLCHINLHKTFAIPHGGGGPGAGPIAVKKHLAPYLPSHPVVDIGNSITGPVSASPYGSAGILPISWMYMQAMGYSGLRKASQAAIMNANYIAKRLEGHYPILYTGKGGFVAHECILDLRDIEKNSGIKVEDVAKRLMDYGFHAPTMSWPVVSTLMVEPTESESKVELDRFCDAMISIREEIRQVEAGQMDRNDNPLKNAPHTATVIVSDNWDHPYSREQAAFPSQSTKDFKFWPAVGRIDNVYGDRNLVCTSSQRPRAGAFC